MALHSKMQKLQVQNALGGGGLIKCWEQTQEENKQNWMTVEMKEKNSKESQNYSFVCTH